MYRLNVGWRSIPGLDDIDLSRDWFDDSPYLGVDAWITQEVRSNIDIEYSSLPEYVAPLEVYSTARITRPLGSLKWTFPVDPGFTYLIRFHFCEITREDRRFRIFINNQISEDCVDLTKWSKGIGIPVYKDYLLKSLEQHKNLGNLSVELKCIENVTCSAILNGLEIFKLSDQNNSLAGKNPFGVRGWKSQRGQKKEAGVVHLLFRIVGGFFCFILLLSIFYFLKPSWTGMRTSQQWPASSEYCQYFSLAELKTATNDFSTSNIIGKGGFGTVYKGYIASVATTAAIKRGNPTSSQGLEEFQTEITVLSKLRHRHLVSLIGYCMDDKEMILVYDYLPRGTLRDQLCNSRRPPLPWKQRLEICIGAARGIHYLHGGAKQAIIHRDVKSTNILLDQKWMAKVADFGLSKLGPNMLSNTHITTLVKGTFGYLDPEYYKRQKLSEKSDVYSFGVVLFEVLCARPAVLPAAEENEEEVEQANLAEWALFCYKSGKLYQIIDPYLCDKIGPECLNTYVEIARKCLADKGTDRPSTATVLWNLELAMQQQIVADSKQEERNVCHKNDYFDVQDAIVVDLRSNHSDATPGVEFSELIIPLGR